MRCVCYYCSRLLVDKDSEKVKEIIAKTRGNPRRRMGLIYDLCKSKNVCEGADKLDNGDPENLEEGETEIKAGGCGRYQPGFRRVGLDIFAEVCSSLFIFLTEFNY